MMEYGLGRHAAMLGASLVRGYLAAFEDGKSGIEHLKHEIEERGSETGAGEDAITRAKSMVTIAYGRCMAQTPPRKAA